MNRVNANSPLLAMALLTVGVLAGGPVLAAAQQQPASSQQATGDARSAGLAGEGKQFHGRGHAGKSGKRHHGLERMIQAMDSNQDGRVTRAEFDAGMAERKARKEQRMQHMAKERPQSRDALAKQGPRPQLSFDALDTRRQGYITRTEVLAYAQAARTRRAAEARTRMDERFAAADLNRDGKLSRVEVSQNMQRLDTRFNWVDSNSDGFLTRQEIQAGRQR